jgi:hypothetical protein
MPISHCKSRIGVAPTFRNWNDVENRQTLHFIRMVERKAVRDPTTAIVSDDVELREAEFIHYLY